MFFFISPLEQFETFTIFNFVSNIFLFFLIIFFLFFVLIFFFQYSVKYIVPNRWFCAFEIFYNFVLDLIRENLGVRYEIFFPFFFVLFNFLLVSNLLGMVPYSFTLTSQLVITISLSLCIWVGKLFIGFKFHGFHLFAILTPAGIPFVSIPFFVIIELLSFFIPLGALGIRLFANIIAGHVLLKVIAGFSWTIMINNFFMFVTHLFVLFILFILLFLETAVAFIQAYIFSILAALITGDIIKGSH